MTFPAELSFKRDNSLTPSARRVYEYLTTTLDFQQPRAVKAQVECVNVETDRETFSKAVTELVHAGYLAEHPREAFRIRVLTLAWSLKT